MGEDIVSFPIALANINEAIGEKLIIIDEWDCLFREDKFDKKIQEEYIELLCGLFKGAPSQKFIWNHLAEGQLVRSRIKNMKVF